MCIQLGYQLYSSRNFGPVSRTLDMLAGMGFTSVEGYADILADTESLAADLMRFGLTMSSAHMSLGSLESSLDDVRHIVSELGIEAVFCPYLSEEDRPSDALGWSDFGGRLQGFAEAFALDDVAFGWHNHDFEFQSLDDGSVPMEHILAAAPGIVWEADIAWITRGGADPFDWIARHGNRIAAVHVKDIAPGGSNLDEDGWADIGDGTLDWPALIKALDGAPIKYCHAEHDNPNDDHRFAMRSLQSFQKWVGGGS